MSRVRVAGAGLSGLAAAWYLARDGATSISYLRLLAGSSQLEITVVLSSAMVLDPDVLC